METKISQKLSGMLSNIKSANDKWTELYSKLATLNGGKKQWSNFDYPSIGKCLAFLEMLRIEKPSVVVEFIPMEWMDAYNQLRYSFSYIKDGRTNNGNPSSDWSLLREFIGMVYAHFEIPFNEFMTSPLTQKTWEQKEKYYRSVVEKTLSSNINVIISSDE